MKRAPLLHGVYVAHALLLRPGFSDKLDDAFTLERGIIRTCDVIPDWAVLGGDVLTLFAPILCSTPKIVEIVADTTIRSNAAIRTSDLVFYVHYGARLTFDAPFVIMEKKATTDHVLHVDGIVSFEVNAWPPDQHSGDEMDHNDVVFLNYGSIETDGIILYTSNSIVAADLRGEYQVDDEPVAVHPDFDKALARVHERINRGRSGSSTPRTGPVTMQGINIDTPPGTASSYVNHHHEQGWDSKGGRFNESPTLVEFSNSKSEQEERRTARAKKKPLPPRDSIEDDLHEPLKVGQKLTGRLACPTSSAKLYFKGEEGSLKLDMDNKRRPTDLPRMFPLRQSVNLTTADPDKMKKILERRESIRLDLRNEELDQKKKEREARADMRETDSIVLNMERSAKSGGTSIFSFILALLPFGKHGFLERRARAHARAHLGEAYITIDNKGTLEGKVDGTVVIRHRAPAFLFFYRKKDESYELHTTDTGLKVVRGGHEVWNMTAHELWLRL